MQNGTEKYRKMKRGKKYVVLLCILITGIVTTMTSPLLTDFADITNTDINKMGIVFSFTTLGYLGFSTLFGVLAQKINPSKLIFIIIIGYVIALTLVPISINIIQLCALFMLVGGGNGSLMSLLTALLTSVKTNDTSNIVGKAHMSFGIGAILGPILVSISHWANISWRYIYYFLVVILVIIGAMFFEKSNETKITVDKLRVDDINIIVTNKYLIILAVCIALYNGAEVASWGWLSTNLKAGYKISFLCDFAVSLFWISMTIGRIFITRCCKNVTIEKTLLVLLVMLIFSNVFVLINYNVIYQVLCIFLLGLSYSAICPLLISLGLNKNVGDSYTVSSILLGSGSIGIMLIPYIMGVGGPIGKLSPLLSIIICLLLLLIINKDSE